MDIPVNYETKTKDSFFDVIKSFFATSIDNEDEVDKRVKEIEQQQDEINISLLEKMVAEPKVGKTKNNKKKMDTKINDKVNVKDVKEEEEKENSGEEKERD